MGLYKVTATFQYMVVAETPEEAQEIGRENAREALKQILEDADLEGTLALSTTSVYTRCELPPGWDGFSTPWGAEDEQAIDDYLLRDLRDLREDK